MDGKRVALPKMWVSAASRESLRAFCASHGITRTALMEAMGEIMARLVAGEIELPPMGYAIVNRAREIDAERQRRSS